MRYYAKYNESGELISVGISEMDGTEISEAEFNNLLEIITEKAALVEALYRDEITASSIRSDWRGEIVKRVEDRKNFEAEHGGSTADPAIPEDIALKAQAYDIITGVSE